MKPWKDGDDNGGATSPGVTKDAITVVAVVPNETQLSGTSAAAGTAPVSRVDLSPGGTYADAIHDYLLPLMKYYETWGRDIDVKFVTSSGSDEAAQRADAVTIKALDAVRGDGHGHHRTRRARRRDREGQDLRVRRRDHRGQGAGAGSVPVGSERRAVGGGELG